MAQAKHLTSMTSDLTFRPLSDLEAEALISAFPSYSDNPRLSIPQFTKYLNSTSDIQSLWLAAFNGSQCTALAYLMKTPPGTVLIAEVQAVIKGYGKHLIFHILSQAPNCWLCADPTAKPTLVQYYRQFGLKEHVIKLSKWTNTPEHAFYQASSPASEAKIFQALNKADKLSPAYSPAKL